MTMTGTSRGYSDHWWERVRAALSALRPVPQPLYRQAAIARSMGIKLKLGTLIDEALVAGWSRAAERHVSLSLLVIEIDGAGAYNAAHGQGEADAGVLRVMQAVVAALPREGDTCLRLGPCGFVVVLPDLPVLMARALALKISDTVRRLAIVNKESHAGVLTVSVGLAVTNPHGGYDRRFFEAGAEALKKAQRKGLGHLHAVDLRPALDRRRKRSERVLRAA